MNKLLSSTIGCSQSRKAHWFPLRARSAFIVLNGILLLLFFIIVSATLWFSLHHHLFNQIAAKRVGQVVEAWHRLSNKEARLFTHGNRAVCIANAHSIGRVY